MRSPELIVASLLLFASSLGAQTASSGPPPNALDTAVKAAQSALGNQVGTSHLTQTQSERLVRACSALRILDVDQHDRSCRKNPAVLWSLESLTKPTTKLSPRFAEDVRDYAAVYREDPGSHETVKSRMVIPKDADVSAALKEAVVSDIDIVSVAYLSSAERGNNRSRLRAEANLNVLFGDLKKALGSKGPLLPDDPLALAGADAIDREISSLQAFRSRLDRAATLFPLPDTTATLESIDRRLARLNSIVTTNQVGTCHLARDEIAANIDLGSWSRSTANRSILIQSEEKRLDREWNLQYPSLSLSPIPSGLNRDQNADSHRFPLSARVLEATSSFELDPTSWLILESSLLANYSEIGSLSPAERNKYELNPVPPYQTWRASLLSDQDLPLALAYGKAVLRNRPAILSTVTEVPFAPDLEQERYHTALVASLTSEIERRKNATASSKETPVIPLVQTSAQSDPESKKSPSELERLYRVKLAESRYQSPTAMPPLIADLTKAYVNEVHDGDLRKAGALYESLYQLNEKAALAAEPLGSEQREMLRKAKFDVLAVLSQLDVLIKAWERNGYSWSDSGKRDLESMIVVLSSRPPPDQGPGDLPPNTVGPVTPPRPPSSSSGTIVAPEKSSPRVADAELLSLFNQASVSLQAAQAGLRSVDTQVSLRGHDPGKITVSEDQLLKGKIDYHGAPRDQAKARLPEPLQSWKGFIDPSTKKPYDYQTKVIDFKSFSPVGGGIHFGNRAVLTTPTDLHHFILTYDVASKTLLLVGPSDERYAYTPIDPQDLKALYRYAASEDNAAVSVGWSGEYVRYTPKAGTDRETDPVLLNPYFVDTHIGQRLVAADSIPWRLGDSSLPSGVLNPIAVPFKTAEDRFFAARTEALNRYCRDIKQFTDEYGHQLASTFAAKTYLDLLAVSILSTTTVSGAKEDFLNRANYDALKGSEAVLKKQLELATINPKFNSSAPTNPFSSSPRGKESDDDVLAELWRKAYKSQAQPSRTKIQQELKEIEAEELKVELFAKSFDDAKSRLELLQGIAFEAVEIPPVEGKWTKLLVSVLKARKEIPDRDLGGTLGAVLPTTTLAVLLDEPTQINIEDGKIRLAGRMTYRYASTIVRVQGDSVIMTQGVGVKATSVETISELGDLANNALPTLAAEFAPLSEVLEEARVVAFLRWCRQPGNLLSIDLSELADVRSFDRDGSATPDAILRGKDK